MNITSKNQEYRPGIFIDNKKVSKTQLLYLQAIENLSQKHESLNSEMIIKHLGRSRSAFITISRLEQAGYIHSESVPYQTKNWKLTDTGKAILIFIKEQQ